MSVRFKPRSVLEIALPDGRHAYGVMLAKRPHFSFFSDEDGKLNPLADEAFDRKPLFSVPGLFEGRLGLLCRP